MKHVIFSVLTFLLGCDANLGQPTVNDMGMFADAEMDVVQDADVPPELGDPCSGPSDCVEDQLCVGTSDGTYTCMALCSVPYEVCSTGGVCLALSGRPESVCFTGGDAATGTACRTNIDCTSGKLCIGAQSQFICVEACDASTSCGAGSNCSTLGSGASVCIRDIGAICEHSSDCKSEFTCTTDEDGFLDVVSPGFCTIVDCEPACPQLSVCLVLPDAPKATCVSECETDADCRFIHGWRCRDKEVCALLADPAACEARLGNKSACVPPEIP